MDIEEMTERIEHVITSYLDQLDDPGEVDSQDLAENIARNLTKAEQ